ncbi:hypothetical protein BH20ACT17_BH20ACT17_19780 [soil metagenome]
MGNRAEREYEEAAQEAAGKLAGLSSITPQALPGTWIEGGSDSRAT